MNANALSTETGTADNHGKASRLQGLCVERSQEGGRGTVGNVRRNKGRTPKSYWPGARFGVREPEPAEKPLSWDEVMHALHWEVL